MKTNNFNMNNTENNKLIAEFMGGKYDSAFFNLTKNSMWLPIHGIVFFEHLKYDSSWDWLMPVIQKIDSYGYNVKISRISVNITKILTDEVIVGLVCGNIDKKINLCYNAVVQFIKWYNNQK